jgi:hypothetical protein
MRRPRHRGATVICSDSREGRHRSQVGRCRLPMAMRGATWGPTWAWGPNVDACFQEWQMSTYRTSARQPWEQKDTRLHVSRLCTFAMVKCSCAAMRESERRSMPAWMRSIVVSELHVAALPMPSIGLGTGAPGHLWRRLVHESWSGGPGGQRNEARQLIRHPCTPRTALFFTLPSTVPCQ